MERGIATHSCSSSIDSNNHPPSVLSSAASSLCPTIITNDISSPSRGDGLDIDAACDTETHIMSTDLRLGLSISPPHNHISSSTPPRREQIRLDWPPIKPLMRSTLTGKVDNSRRCTSLFVKVYMEGIPIGRKLDLFEHDGYYALITALAHMFKTTILCPDVDRVHSENHHVLIYEDKEGDWMMVGDVPWEIFLTTVKRLKITRADRC